MSEILIRGYKAKEQIEEIIQEAKYGANNCMIGEGLEIIEIPAHGDLIDRDSLFEQVRRGMLPVWIDTMDVKRMPVIIPSNKEDTE